MSYVVESGSSQRARKRRRTAITLLVVVALMAGAFYYASTYWKNQTGKSSAATCPTSTKSTGPAKPGAPTRGQVTVNVYNATSREGLAASTAKEVKALGFVVGTVANDPQSKAVPGVGEVRYGGNGAEASKLVTSLLKGANQFRDARADASVDLVLGDAFQSLGKGTPASAGATTSGTQARC